MAQTQEFPIDLVEYEVTTQGQRRQLPLDGAMGGLAFDANDFVGEATAVLGVRGSGKSNTAKVLIEELLKHGVPMAIFDIDGEYWTLKADYEMLLVGYGPRCDLAADPEEMGLIAERSLREGIPVIIDFSTYPSSAEVFGAATYYVDVVFNLSMELRRPYLFVLEEAHDWLPESGFKHLGEEAEKFRRLAIQATLRGRKRGLGAILITQRGPQLDKNVLTQARQLFLHQAVYETDISAYKRLVPKSMWGGDIEATLARFIPGDCYIKILGEDWTIGHIRKTEVYDAAFTPKLGQTKVPTMPELKALRQGLVAQLNLAKGSLAEGAGNPWQSKWLASHQAMVRLEKEMESLRQQNAELHSQLRFTRSLRVDPDSLAQGLAKALGGTGVLVPGNGEPRPLVEGTQPLVSGDVDQVLREMALHLGACLGWSPEETDQAFRKVTGLPLDKLRGRRLHAALQRLEARVQPM